MSNGYKFAPLVALIALTAPAGHAQQMPTTEGKQPELMMKGDGK